MQFVINILINFSLYVLVGAAFWMLYKTHKFFNLGHGAMIAVGGYAAYVGGHYLFGTSLTGLCESILFAILVSVIVGLLLDTFLYRLLRKQKKSSLVLLIVSLGVMTIIQSVIALVFTSQYKVIDVAESFSSVIKIGDGAITSIQLLTIILAIITVGGLYFLVTKTTFGRAFRAVSDDTEVSQIVGVPVERVLAGVAIIAAAYAGLAGSLSGIDTGIIPTLGFSIFLKAVVSDIIGGLDNFWGLVLGAALVAFLENIVVLTLGGEWRDVAVYSLLLVFLLVRPKGILSSGKN